jgi:uncharacterized membrane protein
MPPPTPPAPPAWPVGYAPYPQPHPAALYAAYAQPRPAVPQAKLLGGLGSILLFLFWAPAIGPILAFVGLILVGVAVNQVSRAVGSRPIFDNFLYSTIAAIAGISVGVLIALGALVRLVGIENFGTFDWAGWTPSTADAISLAIYAVIGLVVLWVAFLVSALFTKKASDEMATRLNIPLFRTAGLVYLIGAALTVVLVGFLIVIVAEVLFAVAFFRIPDGSAPAMQAPPVAPVWRA